MLKGKVFVHDISIHDDGYDNVILEWCVADLHIWVHVDGFMSIVGAPTCRVVPCDGSCSSRLILEEVETHPEYVEFLRGFCGKGEVFLTQSPPAEGLGIEPPKS